MWLSWLHSNTNTHLDLGQIDCYFTGLRRPHKIMTLNIVIGLDEYLLNTNYPCQEAGHKRGVVWYGSSYKSEYPHVNFQLMIFRHVYHVY